MKQALHVPTSSQCHTCWKRVVHISQWRGPQMLRAIGWCQDNLQSLYFMNVFLWILNIRVNFPGNLTTNRLLSSALKLSLLVYF